MNTHERAHETKPPYPAQDAQFISYKESIRRAGRISEGLREKIISPWYDYPAWYACLHLYLLLKSQMRFLERVNSEDISCDVAWNTVTGFPSHPSLLADVKKFLTLEKCPPLQRPLIGSYERWMPFSRERTTCACGPLMKERGVQVYVLLRSNLRREDTYLRMWHYIGARSRDMDHLRFHFSEPEIWAKDMRETRILYSASHIFRIEHGKNVIVRQGARKVKEFDDVQFFASLKDSFKDPILASP